VTDVDEADLILALAQGLHAGAVGHVHLHEAEARVRLQPGKARLLEGGVVVVVQVVEADHLVAAREQAQRGVHADKTGSAGDEDLHGGNWLGDGLDKLSHAHASAKCERFPSSRAGPRPASLLILRRSSSPSTRC